MDGTLKAILLIVIAFHGIGHLIGITFISNTIHFEGFGNSSWFFTDVLKLDSKWQQLLAVSWIIGTVGFLVSLYGLWTEADWWRYISWIMVVFSMILFIIWWNSFPNFFPFQANIGNALIILGLIYLK